MLQAVFGGCRMASKASGTTGIWGEIDERYDQAQGSGAASTTPTEVQRVCDGSTGVEFIVQVAANPQQKARRCVHGQGWRMSHTPLGGLKGSWKGGAPRMDGSSHPLKIEALARSL